MLAKPRARKRSTAQPLLDDEELTNWAAALVDVPPQMVRDAEALRRSGAGDVIRAVEAGLLELSAALEIVRCSKGGFQQWHEQKPGCICNRCNEPRPVVPVPAKSTRPRPALVELLDHTNETLAGLVASCPREWRPEFGERLVDVGKSLIERGDLT